jgi:hypothetical protein
MIDFNQKIEIARESYSIKFLNEKFENRDDNKLRKNKLSKLLEKTTNVDEQIKNREQKV